MEKHQNKHQKKHGKTWKKNTENTPKKNGKERCKENDRWNRLDSTHGDPIWSQTLKTFDPAPWLGTPVQLWVSLKGT
jgi:hypothetical protein